MFLIVTPSTLKGYIRTPRYCTNSRNCKLEVGVVIRGRAFISHDEAKKNIFYFCAISLNIVIPNVISVGKFEIISS